VFVNLDQDAEPLSEVTGGVEKALREDAPFIDELRPIESWSFSTSTVMAANWKVVVDNFLECYHCQKAHPDFCDLFDMDAYETEIGRWWSVQRGPKVRGENSAYPVAGEEQVQRGMFWFVWPTTTINMLPGVANLTVMSILPHGLDRASFSGHRYALPGAEADRDRMRYMNEVLVVEDQDLCESVQRGLRSRSYNQGRFIYSPDGRGVSEHAVHHFHRLVHEALEEGRSARRSPDACART
jgi:choline monooxygenase